MIYVSSDWHGISWDRIQELFRKAGFGSEDYLFILGDVIDRGEHGVDLIKHIMYEPNITLIRGNHEQMMLSCRFLFDEITDQSIRDLTADSTRWLRVWKSNGGEQTIAGLAKESPETRKMILEYIEETPLYDTVSVGDRDFVLVHAGLGLGENGKVKAMIECSVEDFLWTRPYLTTHYSSEFTTIFGHTPTGYYGSQYRGKILKTGTWINVDTGAASGLTPSLLRLDDMQEFYLD